MLFEAAKPPKSFTVSIRPLQNGARHTHSRQTRVWARGYFCCSSGNVTDEVITQYIENQHHEEDADFRVEGEDGPTRPPKPSA